MSLPSASIHLWRLCAGLLRRLPFRFRDRNPAQGNRLPSGWREHASLAYPGPAIFEIPGLEVAFHSWNIPVRPFSVLSTCWIYLSPWVCFATATVDGGAGGVESSAPDSGGKQ